MSAFVPYWLIHEPGKDHGIAVVDLDSAITAERAVEIWKASDQVAEFLRIGVDLAATPVEARLITEPFVKS